MFRFFNTNDLISEIKKELDRAQYSTQIYIDEFDLYMLSSELLKALDNNLNIEIIIVSKSNKKTMRLVNLCKRLIDLDANIYWKVNSSINHINNYFAIFDKQYLISGFKEAPEGSAEEFVRNKNDFFNTLAIESNKMMLLSGDIDLNFNINKTIISKNEEVQLSWNTQNAHYINIIPDIGLVDASGSINLVVKKDTKFTIEAKNKDERIKKSVFIKVLKDKELEFEVDVFDTILKDYISIFPSDNHRDNYGVYLGQQVRISWSINFSGKLKEASIGELPLEGNFVFECKGDKIFIFSFISLANKKIKKIVFHSFLNNEIPVELYIEKEDTESEMLELEEASTSIKKEIPLNLIQKLRKFIYKIKFK